MNIDYILIEIKKLNPKCEIKIDSNSNIYVSKKPDSLVLPEGIIVYQNNGKYYISGSDLSAVSMLPLSRFPKNERDYFSEIVFQNIGFDNIYELTRRNTTDLMISYLEQISELDVANKFSLMAYEHYKNPIKYICYEGLKKENKFDGIGVNKESRKKLYEYVTQISNPHVYKNPLDIQKYWESFQSWHISGGTKPDEKTFTHRFYISISPAKVHELAQKLIEKYREYQKPYYFKIAEGRQSKDSIVVYTSHDTLNTTLQIFRDLEPYMKSMPNEISTPHPLIYPLTSWLGYASEIMDGRTSYTDLISDVISIPLREAINEFAKAYKNDNINGMPGAFFFGDTDVIEKIKRGQIVIKAILNDPNRLNKLINDIYKYMGKESINFENIYYTDEVVADLMNYRERFKTKNSSLNLGFINLKLLIIPITLILGIIIATVLRK